MGWLYVLCHVTYAFQSESTLYSFLNVKELLARSRHEIWSLSDCNWTRTHNHLVHKQTLNHLAKLTKWFSVRLSTKWLWFRAQLQSLNLMGYFGFLHGLRIIGLPLNISEKLHWQYVFENLEKTETHRLHLCWYDTVQTHPEEQPLPLKQTGTTIIF